MPHIGEKAEIAGSRGAAQAITPTGSAFTYTAPANGIVVLSGGTVTLIEYGRSASFYLLGLITGSFAIARGDQVRVTYAVAPTMTFIPN
jgi:hypothetical protein